MPAFDTSALVALFDSGHEHHGKAKEEFRDADEVLLHPCVLSEFTTVVRRNAKDAGQDGNKAARQALAALLAQPRVRIVHEMAYDAVVELYLAVPTLSFTDAVVCETVHGFDKKQAVTFDKGLQAGWKVTEGQRARRAKQYA